ncbi:group I truncated hemoglobin [Melghirimyces algeriensis]|uniref:Hemoglobin n=1 Tax=Melghirimyces algeriensis TaxID=910412 RepID=A0A521FAD0_9BACL|nr:group 1 truncated hemoglobin [Melghirimyces algeriensis]SMO93107.1 hemoglobin [Melghirimyces algeriensis]
MSEIYYMLGGDQGIAAILNDYYDRLTSDEELAPYFEKVDTDELRKRQIRYFTNHMLGRTTHTYKDHILRETHEGLQITFDHYERAIKHVNAAMRKHRVPLEARVKVEAMFRSFKPHITYK